MVSAAAAATTVAGRLRVLPDSALHLRGTRSHIAVNSACTGFPRGRPVFWRSAMYVRILSTKPCKPRLVKTRQQGLSGFEGKHNLVASKSGYSSGTGILYVVFGLSHGLQLALNCMHLNGGRRTSLAVNI